ncbi:hypothetical protein B0T10DRAFT_579408, partial [Thelonectria olida]
YENPVAHTDFKLQACKSAFRICIVTPVVYGKYNKMPSSSSSKTGYKYKPGSFLDSLAYATASKEVQDAIKAKHGVPYTTSSGSSTRSVSSKSSSLKTNRSESTASRHSKMVRTSSSSGGSSGSRSNSSSSKSSGKRSGKSHHRSSQGRERRETRQPTEPQMDERYLLPAGGLLPVRESGHGFVYEYDPAEFGEEEDDSGCDYDEQHEDPSPYQSHQGEYRKPPPTAAAKTKTDTGSKQTHASSTTPSRYSNLPSLPPAPLPPLPADYLDTPPPSITAAEAHHEHTVSHLWTKIKMRFTGKPEHADIPAARPSSDVVTAPPRSIAATFKDHVARPLTATEAIDCHSHSHSKPRPQSFSVVGARPLRNSDKAERSRITYDPAKDPMYAHIPRTKATHFPGEITISNGHVPRVTVYAVEKGRHISPRDAARTTRDQGDRWADVSAWRGAVRAGSPGEAVDDERTMERKSQYNKGNKNKAGRLSVITAWPEVQGADRYDEGEDGIDRATLGPEDSLSAVEEKKDRESWMRRREVV